MKVLFINPPVRQQTAPGDIPYGLAIIAAITENKNHDVTAHNPHNIADYQKEAL